MGLFWHKQPVGLLQRVVVAGIAVNSDNVRYSIDVDDPLSDQAEGALAVLDPDAILVQNQLEFRSGLSLPKVEEVFRDGRFLWPLVNVTSRCHEGVLFCFLRVIYHVQFVLEGATRE